MPLSDDPNLRSNQLANLNKAEGPGNVFAVKHGCRMEEHSLMLCKRCALHIADLCDASDAAGRCELERQYMDARRADLLRLEHINPAVDSPAIELLLQAECRLLRASRYLAAIGETREVKGSLEYQGIAKALPAMVNSWCRLLGSLGLTPPERKRLSSSGETGIGASLLKAIREAARTEEGEFEEVAQDD